MPTPTGPMPTSDQAVGVPAVAGVTGQAAKAGAASSATAAEEASVCVAVGATRGPRVGARPKPLK